MTIRKTISATVPADVKAEVKAFAKAHGTTITALAREMFTRIAAGDKETLAWLEEERQRQARS